MPTTGGDHKATTSGTKAAAPKKAGAKASAAGKQGGALEQHVKAGQQSHKNSK